jgi:hypothetical protein
VFVVKLFLPTPGRTACRLRSYLSTMKKQDRSVMETVKSLFAGKILLNCYRASTPETASDKNTLGAG